MKRTFEFTLDNETKITVSSPTLRMWHNFLESTKDSEIVGSISDIIGETTDYIENNFTIDDLRRFIADFPAWVNGEKQSDPN